MKRHIKRWTDPVFNRYRDLSITKKISTAFLLVLIPVIIMVAVWFSNVLEMNEHYNRSVRNTSAITDFSLDFKQNYDYKIYLIIVGNKSYQQQNPVADVVWAKRTITQVAANTENQESRQRALMVWRYLDKLEEYTKKIHTNLQTGNHYDENQEIWELSIQTVTTSIQETVLQILYYENRQSQEIYNDMQDMTLRMIWTGVLLLSFLAAVTVLMITIIPRTITRPIRDLNWVTEQVAKGELDVRAHVEHGAELKVLGDSLNVMIEKISSLIDRVKEEQTNLREAELEILQMQINPHFLYNTLDTIVWLAETDNKEAVVNMVETLSEFFRATLNGGKEIVEIASETRHITSYLQIQKVRYQDILDYEIQIPSELDHCLIPKITLQPLVENALYHGIKYKRGRGKIRVYGEVRQRERKCILTVEDDGAGMREERLLEVKESIHQRQKESNEFYGIYNVNERIRLKFGEDYGLNIYSVYKKGTRVEVCLPLAYREEHMA